MIKALGSLDNIPLDVIEVGSVITTAVKNNL